MFDDMLHAKRLRPLIPRPTSSITRDVMFGDDASVHQTQTGFLTNNGEPLLTSSRWNPRPEQIQALEEMYKTGLRTPSADQIQKIAAKLSKFGKIEGKNVFYWFQNHKARERQKRRRLMDANNQPQQAEMHDNNIGTNMGLKEPGINMKVMDVEPPQKWSTYSYSTCGSTFEDSVSKNRTVEAESKRNVWAQFDEKELEQQTICKKRIKKATFQVDMSPLSNYYIFSTRITTQRSSKQPIDYNNEDKIASRNNLLELFPLGINNQTDITTEEECGVLTENNVAFCPRQFFEFLPLKS